MKQFADVHRAIEVRIGARAYKLIRYLISGGTAALVNLTSLFLLVHFAHMHYLYASILAFIISIAASFTMQKFWTFGDTQVHDLHMQFTRYLIVIFLGLLLNTLVVYALVEKMNTWYLLAQIIATVIIAVINFFAYKHFVFRERNEEESLTTTV